ncbi:hypothetical protein [Caldalkalibacillus salinus]|uniref:hypothetical protein n=1 Tax=Caldalkalibacillus salinus TaxID=2803787 RepID=UPI0019218A8D|nr:hypothetical protein [Caldalkalibacillus salinus]
MIALDLLFILIFVITGSVTALVYGVSGWLIYFFPSLTYRAYRRIFIEITAVTSASFAIIYYLAIEHVQEGYPLQNTILPIGALLLFFTTFFSTWVRRKIVLVTAIWGAVCMIWSYFWPM